MMTAAVRESMRRVAPVLVSDRRASLIAALRERLAPDVVLSHPDTVGYVHRVDGERHLWFLTNLSDESCDLRADFAGMTAPAFAWSLNTAAPMAMDAERGSVRLTLAAHESVALVFAPDLADAPAIAPAETPTRRISLRGWTLTAEGREYPMAGDPEAWERIPALRHFSGTAAYTCRFTIDQETANSPAAALTLSGLSAAARVSLNGEPVGDIWTHPLTLSLAGHLRAGENLLEIEAASTLINEMMARPNGGAHTPVPERLDTWPYYGTVINVHRKARLNTVREATEQPAPIPSGIWGELSLVW